MTYSLRRREVINTPVDNHAHRGGRGTQGNRRGRPRRTMPDLHNTLAEVAISSQPLSSIEEMEEQFIDYDRILFSSSPLTSQSDIGIEDDQSVVSHNEQSHGENNTEYHGDPTYQDQNENIQEMEVEGDLGTAKQVDGSEENQSTPSGSFASQTIRSENGDGNDAIPLWLQERIERIVQRRVEHIHHIIEPTVLPLTSTSISNDNEFCPIPEDVHTAPSASMYLVSTFPEIHSEIPFLRQFLLAHKQVTAYKGYRQFVILNQLAEGLGFPIHSRQLKIRLSPLEGVMFEVGDVYAWAGITAGTFANNKRDVAAAYHLLGELEQLVLAGDASPALQKMHQDWYPYTLSCRYWWSKDPQNYPESLKWTWSIFSTKVNQLRNLLSTVM
ncbi:uncharacterized protein C8R40DRAFT_1119132 [Lentinula edodes]|uniref:uncharacterized protein n=1 Tax=Lentinula edodes TaxID=5353 RepID=UPI001E8DB2DF|nr:uncharacterized protein C8R40DRAFT_1119132 [Lentinula edodes]KAH7871937.1 hypothetical protein C8R40DRAFT_1119132 [Lentinula edodes]